jgi:L-arabinose isomerase
MKKIKIGYLPLYTKLYDDINIKRRDPLKAYMNTLVDMIASQGFEVVLPDDLCRLPEEFEAAAEMFNADDEIVAVVTQHLAYSPSLSSYQALLTLKAPIIVFDTTPDYALLSAALYEERTFANHGIHGVQEMCSMLKRNGKPYSIVAGHAFHSEVITELSGLLRAAAAARAFRNARIGLIGRHFEGMEDFLIPDEVYREKIGGQVFHLTPEIMKTYLDKVTDCEVEDEIRSDRNRYDVRVNNEENYAAATKTGLALRKWIKDEGLTAITVNFLHISDDGLLKMPFPEACKEMEMGIGYAGEGDTLTAGLVGALLSVYPNTSFVEMFCPDWEKDLVILSHMGEMNTNLSSYKPIIRDERFSYERSGDTVTVGAGMRAGDAVLINLVPVDSAAGKFDLVLSKVRMTADAEPAGAYGPIIQGWLDPMRPVGDYLKAYSMAGGTHHSALTYGVDIAEIEAFGRFMGFNTVVI